jgi:hypothetical protein
VLPEVPLPSSMIPPGIAGDHIPFKLCVPPTKLLLARFVLTPSRLPIAEVPVALRPMVTLHAVAACPDALDPYTSLLPEITFASPSVDPMVCPVAPDDTTTPLRVAKGPHRR